MRIPHQTSKAVIALTFVALLATSMILGSRPSRRISETYIPTITETNVTRVSLAITHGTNHTFYYRGRLRWEWDELCKRLALGRIGLGSHTPHQTLRTYSGASQRSICRTRKPAEILWVRCQHLGQPPNPARFRFIITDAKGHKRVGRSTGGVCDLVRGVTVSHCPPMDDIAEYRGGSIRIVDTSHDTELVKIAIR
jgi:hypothetical protein